MKLIWTLVLLTLLGACATNDKTSSSFTRDIPEFDYPYSVSRFEFEAQGEKLQMGYMDVRPPQQEKGTIVLLHGKNFSGFYFKTLIDHFVSNGLRVIVPDQIGFGKSSKPLSYQFSFQALAHNTLALLDSLQVRKFSLLGHSMGGDAGHSDVINGT